MNKISIIGSGFGGLSLGIRLQAAGYQVTIFEKNGKVGGHAYPLKIGDYSFDMGPSLITAPDVINDIFTSAGKNMNDYLDLIPLDPFYRIYYDDGRYLDYSGDSEMMKTQMAEFDPRDAEKYDAFMDVSKKICDAVIGEKLGSQPFMTWKAMMVFAPRAIRLKALMPSYAFAKQYFRHEYNRFAFSFHPLFIGGNPFKAPAVYQMIPYLEKTGGVWYTSGGMYTLVQALEKLFIDLGGTVKTHAEVSRIVVEKRHAKGVVANDEFYPADAVVSNADFIHTYKNLLTPEHRRKWTDARLQKVDYSMSAFLLFLGVNKKYDQLKHHTLMLSRRYKELIYDIFDRKIVPDDFSLYVHAPSRSDDTMAPEGSESIYVLSPVANLQGNYDWAEKADEYKERILNFLEHDFGLKDLREHIEVSRVFTPLDFEKKNNNTYGSAWGVEPKLTQTAIFRPHNRSEDVNNLYLVGASTHPGAGLPGVMMTAETTAGLIQTDIPG